MIKTIRISVVFLALANQALAAQGPAKGEEVDALNTAVMNQQMMVAAFQCNEVENYNRFVTAYRSELQSSDAVLKTYFVRNGKGEAGYDRFKTKAANLWALEQARHSDTFCADARSLFADAIAHRGRLAAFVASRSSPAEIGIARPEARFGTPIRRSADTDTLKGARAMKYRRDAKVIVPVKKRPKT